MKTITCQIPNSLHEALVGQMKTARVSCNHLVAAALSQFLERPLHTLFQVSTSAAMVEGLFQGAVRVSDVLSHGDFGLGTFVELDGEMVLLDGICYQVAPTGRVSVVEGGREVPYAVVTRFQADVSKRVSQVSSFAGLTVACDLLRSSNNIYYAFRAEGRFDVLRTRIMQAVPEGTGIKSAGAGQAEFRLEGVEGTLVGIWSPAFAGAFSVPGYHFHFISADGQQGGHVLDCKAAVLDIQACGMNEMHVSLPETEEFLRADLSRGMPSDLLDVERNSNK